MSVPVVRPVIFSHWLLVLLIIIIICANNVVDAHGLETATVNH